MPAVGSSIASLQHQIASCEDRLQHLKQQLSDAIAAESNGDAHHRPSRWPLDKFEYKRYGRQLIIPQIGLQGQLRLRGSAVLVVGAGGLGCPAAAYLAGAGVGTLGIVDGDVVEESNLHRQILHGSGDVGLSKVESALRSLERLNPSVAYRPYGVRLTPGNALDICAAFDLVLDCTDTPASRYLISDVCVVLGKPLVSASALRTEGQLMLLNSPPRVPGGPTDGGPCYRCIFPKPPPAERVVSCGQGGILGPVVGVMGVLQALEAIKLIVAGVGDPLASAAASPTATSSSHQPSLRLFSAFASPQFRSFGLRSRRPGCAACSAHATVTREALASGSVDYVEFCGANRPVNDVVRAEERISALDLSHTHGSVRGQRQVVVDVRDKVQFELAHLDGSINIPFADIAATPMGSNADESPPPWLEQLRQTPVERPIVVTCRVGNDSQLVVRKMKALGLDADGQRTVVDVKGGLTAWREDVDADFPDY